MANTTNRVTKRARTSLNEQERLCIDRYFSNSFNKTEAMTFAKYKHAEGYIKRFFERPIIADEVERRMRVLTKKANVTAEMVLDEVRKVAFTGLGDLLTVQSDGSAIVDLSDLTDDQRAALSEFKVESYLDPSEVDKEGKAVVVKKYHIKFHDKLNALEKLGRYFKLFTEKVEITDTTLEDRILRGRERARLGHHVPAEETGDEETVH